MLRNVGHRKPGPSTLLAAIALAGCSTQIGDAGFPRADQSLAWLDHRVAESCGEGAAPPDSLPVPTIDSILDRKARSVSNVRWRNARELVADFTQGPSGESVSRPISLDGVLGESLGQGRLSSLSPDERLLIQHNDDGWSVHDLHANEIQPIANPTRDTRAFASYVAPAWSADSRFAAIIERYTPRGTADAPKPREVAGVKVVDMDAHASGIASWASRITIYDRSNPSVVQRLSIDDAALHMRWTPENALLVSTARLFSGDPSTAIVQIEPDSGNMIEIYRTPGRFQDMTPALHPNGKQIAVVLDADNRTWDDFQSILLIDAETGKELRRLTDKLPVLGDDYAWAHDGERIYARVRGGGLDQIYTFPLNGEPRALTRGARNHFNMELSPDGRRLSYQTEDGYGRKDIRVLDLDTGVETVVLVIDEPAKVFRLGEWCHIRWTSTDGVRPYGYLVLPPDLDPGQQYPIIVDIHGGGPGSRLYLFAPLTIRAARGPLEWHAWAALGYVVFVPDYRSTGDYGSDVLTARYKSGRIHAIKDVEDIISGVRFMMNQEFVDPDRVAVLGHSAGGKRAFIALTQHNCFAAAILNEAISLDPVSDFIRLSSGENTGSYPEGVFRQIYGGSLAKFPERYKANYIFDSYRIKTPTLIMLGNEKLGGIYHMPNEVVYSILKQQGVPSRMLKFVEEGHTYSRPESAKLAFEEVRRWLEVHMPAQKN